MSARRCSLRVRSVQMKSCYGPSCFDKLSMRAYFMPLVLSLSKDEVRER